MAFTPLNSQLNIYFENGSAFTLEATPVPSPQSALEPGGGDAGIAVLPIRTPVMGGNHCSVYS